MSHILRDDGDTWNKKRMLLAMIGGYEPGVWRPAAEVSLQRAAGMGKYTGLASAVRAIGVRAGGSQRGEVKRHLADAGACHAKLARLLEEGRYAEVVEGSNALCDSLTRAYAGAQAAVRGEVRGVWDHSGTGLYPGDWGRTCQLLRRYGFTDIMPNVAWPGAAHYASRTVPPSEAFRQYGDQLAACVEAAHRAGLRVHVWKVCWRMDRAPDALVARFRRSGRLQVSDTGEVVNWLCPSNPENLRMEKDSIREIVRDYAVDGIHLDYLRYRDPHVCYCPGCRNRFEERVGRGLPDWPAAVTGRSRLRKEYTRWRAAQISRLVSDLSVAVKRLNPRVKLSAAVFGRYPLCADSVGQDWGSWLRAGTVDFVCPMNYTSDMGRFLEWTRKQAALPGAETGVLPGLGVTAAESYLSPVQVIDQIRTVREQGLRGFVLFDLNRKLETEILPLLGLGVTSGP